MSRCQSLENMVWMSEGVRRIRFLGSRNTWNSSKSGKKLPRYFSLDQTHQQHFNITGRNTTDGLIFTNQFCFWEAQTEWMGFWVKPWALAGGAGGCWQSKGVNRWKGAGCPCSLLPLQGKPEWKSFLSGQLSNRPACPRCRIIIECQLLGGPVGAALTATRSLTGAYDGQRWGGSTLCFNGLDLQPQPRGTLQRLRADIGQERCEVVMCGQRSFDQIIQTWPLTFNKEHDLFLLLFFSLWAPPTALRTAVALLYHHYQNISVKPDAGGHTHFNK